jgi:hypothetical protein
MKIRVDPDFDSDFDSDGETETLIVEEDAK